MINDASYSCEKLMLIGYLEIFGYSFFKECYRLSLDNDFGSNPVMNVCEDFIVVTNKRVLFEGTSLLELFWNMEYWNFFISDIIFFYCDSSVVSYSLSAIDAGTQEIQLSSYNEKRNLGKLYILVKKDVYI